MQTVANLIGSSFNKEWQLVLIMGAIELVLSQVQPPLPCCCLGETSPLPLLLGGAASGVPWWEQDDQNCATKTLAGPKLGGDLVGVGPGHSQLAGLCLHHAHPRPRLQ